MEIQKYFIFQNRTKFRQLLGPIYRDIHSSLNLLPSLSARHATYKYPLKCAYID